MNVSRRIGAWIAPFLLGASLLGASLSGMSLAGMTFPRAAAAQDAEDAQDAASSRSAAFRAVEGPVEDSVPGGTLMVAAYAVIWVLLFGYVFRLARLQSQNARELDRLEGLVRRADEARSGDG